MTKKMLTLSALFISASICSVSAANVGVKEAVETENSDNATIEFCDANKFKTQIVSYQKDRDPRKKNKPQRPTRTPRK